MPRYAIYLNDIHTGYDGFRTIRQLYRIHGSDLINGLIREAMTSNDMEVGAEYFYELHETGIYEAVFKYFGRDGDCVSEFRRYYDYSPGGIEQISVERLREIIREEGMV